MDNFWFFGLNLEKLPNYVQYFGSNIVESVAESWVETETSWVEVDGAGWSWVELGAPFSNTYFRQHYKLRNSNKELKVNQSPFFPLLIVNAFPLEGMEISDLNLSKYVLLYYWLLANFIIKASDNLLALSNTDNLLIIIFHRDFNLSSIFKTLRYFVRRHLPSLIPKAKCENARDLSSKFYQVLLL